MSSAMRKLTKVVVFLIGLTSSDFSAAAQELSPDSVIFFQDRKSITDQMGTSPKGITLRNLLLAKSISIETLTNSSKLSSPEQPAKLPQQEDGGSVG